MNGIYLLLGSNMGNQLEYLRKAKKLLVQNGMKIVDESSIYETAPWGGENQNWFLNTVFQIETSLSAKELLKHTLSVENQLGRIRTKKWGERCIDIDLLYYHNQILTSTELTIPHLGIPDRRFTLIPLAELCPLKEHPQKRKNHVELLADCPDSSACRLTDDKISI